MKQNKRLLNYINRLESHISDFEIKNSKISKATVGWHIDHSLKVMNAVLKTVHSSDPKLYTPNFSVLGKFFFVLGFFPRGKAKAPKHVKPLETILKEELIKQLQLVKSNVKTIESLDKNAFFKHPLFGNINTKRVPRFLELHTKHHLKIINDIMAK